MTCHVASRALLSTNEKRRVLSWLSSYSLPERDDVKNGGQFVQHIDDNQKRRSQSRRPAVATYDRQSETGKKADCSTLLRRITNYKTVNSESMVVVVSSASAFPRGAHVILSTQHEEHTCSNRLFELGRGMY